MISYSTMSALLTHLVNFGLGFLGPEWGVQELPGVLGFI